MAYVQLHELAGREFACQITPYTTIADLKRVGILSFFYFLFLILL